jgi:hypothetical protein
MLFATVLSSQRPLVSQHSSNPFAAAALKKSWMTTINLNRKTQREIVNLKKQNGVVTLISASWNICSIQFWKSTCAQITMASTQLAALLYSILRDPPKRFEAHA